MLKSRKYRSQIELDIISNHSPICLQVGRGFQEACFPFMFNHSQVWDQDFVDLSHKNWNHIYVSSNLSSSIKFMDSLRDLKEEVSKWKRERKKLLKVELSSIKKINRDLFSFRIT